MNEKHPTIKSTAKWFQKSISFLDVPVLLIDGNVTTGFYFKSTENHQYLHSYHVTHIIAKIKFYTAKLFVLGRICSDTNSFDRRSNVLETWLIEKGYSERELRKKKLGPRGFSKDSMLDRENIREEQNQITFKLTFHPVF